VITGDSSSIAFFALNESQMPSRCQSRPPATKRFTRGRSWKIFTSARRRDGRT
jgi:hypothetical protein